MCLLPELSKQDDDDAADLYKCQNGFIIKISINNWLIKKSKSVCGVFVCLCVSFSQQKQVEEIWDHTLSLIIRIKKEQMKFYICFWEINKK